jgi:hypothetical protein
MASNLAGNTCIIEHSACLFRAARLGSTCQPVGGVDSGIVTAGIIEATITPEYTDTRRIEPTNGCGTVMAKFEQVGDLLRKTISGNLVFHDWEMMQLLFGGTLILGRTGTGFPGKVIGWGQGTTNFPQVYLEIIVRNTSQDFGDCSTSGAPLYPTYTGHVLGRARLTPGAQTLNDQHQPVPFDGVISYNPNLVRGPWNDYPGVGPMPAEAEYQAILATAGCGYKTLPLFYSG